jgi:hypothetical protein
VTSFTQIDLEKAEKILSEVVEFAQYARKRDGDPLDADIRDHCACALRDVQKALAKAKAYDYKERPVINHPVEEAAGYARLNEIAKRAALASGGPWHAYDSDESWSLHAGPMQILKAHKSCAMHAEYWPDADDAAFIVHSRADIDWLLNRIAALERQIRDLEEQDD